MRRPFILFQRGAFRLRCIFGHRWGEWSRTVLRTHSTGGLLGNDYHWRQRKCEHCGARQGEGRDLDE